MNGAIVDLLSRGMMGRVCHTSAVRFDGEYCIECIGGYCEGVFGMAKK